MYWCVLVLALALALALALLLLLFAAVAIVIVCVFSLQQINEHCCANYTTIPTKLSTSCAAALLRRGELKCNDWQSAKVRLSHSLQCGRIPTRQTVKRNDRNSGV